MCRSRQRVGEVPTVQLSTGETPLTIDALVAIPVLDRADRPFTSLRPFEFVAAVHNTCRVISVVEIDHMVGDQMHRYVHIPHQRAHPPLQGLAAALFGTDLNIWMEKGDDGVHVASVEGACVARRKLLNRGIRLDPVKAFIECHWLPSSETLISHAGSSANAPKRCRGGRDGSGVVAFVCHRRFDADPLTA